MTPSIISLSFITAVEVLLVGVRRGRRSPPLSTLGIQLVLVSLERLVKPRVVLFDSRTDLGFSGEFACHRRYLKERRIRIVNFSRFGGTFEGFGGSFEPGMRGVRFSCIVPPRYGRELRSSESDCLTFAIIGLELDVLICGIDKRCQAEQTPGEELVRTHGVAT